MDYKKIKSFILKKYDIIILFLIVLIIFLYQNDNKERFTDGAEEILNTVSISEQKMNDIFTNISSDNIKINKKLVIDNELKILKDLQINNDLTVNKLCIGKACLTEDDLKRIKNFEKIAGYAIDGYGSTYLLHEGKFGLKTGDKSGFSDNVWDIIHIFKGWEITVWDSGSFSGDKQTQKNTKKDDLKWKLNGDLQNHVSSYQAKWIGY